MVEQPEAERDVEPSDFVRAQVVDVELLELDVLDVQGVLDEPGLLQVAVDDVDAKDVVGAPPARLHRKPAAVAGQVEYPHTFQGTAASFEQRRKGVSCQRFDPRIVLLPRGLRVRRSRSQTVGETKIVVEGRKTSNLFFHLLLGHHSGSALRVRGQARRIVAQSRPADKGAKNEASLLGRRLIKALTWQGRDCEIMAAGSRRRASWEAVQTEGNH